MFSGRGWGKEGAGGLMYVNVNVNVNDGRLDDGMRGSGSRVGKKGGNGLGFGLTYGEGRGKTGGGGGGGGGLFKGLRG